MGTLLWWTSSSGLVEFQMTLEQAQACSHPGPCDDDVLALSEDPSIAQQLERLNPNHVKQELQGYGAWSDEELDNHPMNLQRILWLAAGDIADNPEGREE